MKWKILSFRGENYVDSATRTIRLGGSDIRGNTTSVDYVVKVQNSKAHD